MRPGPYRLANGVVVEVREPVWTKGQGSGYDIRHRQPAARSDPNPPPVFGLAVPYDHIAAFERSDGIIERWTFTPGAFRGIGTIGHDVRLHFGHDQSATLASTASGSLRLLDGRRGLYFEMRSVKSTVNDGVAGLVERGVVRGVSIQWRWDCCDALDIKETSGGPLYVVRSARLAINEVSLCIAASPRFANTWVGTPAMSHARARFIEETTAARR